MDFKEQGGNSQVDDKVQTCSKQILARASGPPGNRGHSRERGESCRRMLLGSFLSATLASRYAKLITLFEQIFYLNSFRQLRGR